MKNVVSTPQAAKGRVASKAEGVIPPKYILKFIYKSGEADTRVYYCQRQLISDMLEQWGSVDIILQQYIIPKTLQATVYRFYRNERNVFRAECIMNKRSIINDPVTMESFSALYRDNQEDHGIFNHL